MTTNEDLLLERAIFAYQERNYSKAIEILKHLIQLNPKDFDGLHLLGVIHASQGFHQEAIKIYKKCFDLKQSNPTLISNLSTSLSIIGRAQEAYDTLVKSIALDPNNPDLYYNLGNILSQLNQLQKSLEFYAKAIELKPNFYEAINNYGKSLFDLKKYSEALRYFDEALALNNKFIDSLINKGATLYKLRKYNLAIEYYDQVISLHPLNAEAYSNKAVCLYEQRRYKEAIQSCKKSITINPKFSQAYLNLGATLVALNQYDEALINYSKASNLDKNNADLFYNLGKLFFDLKKYKDAIDNFEKALRIDPEMDWIHGITLFAKMQICDWKNFEKNLNIMINEIGRGARATEPLPSLSLVSNPALHYQCAYTYYHSKYFNQVAQENFKKINPKNKIRIGFFSADFGDHPVSRLTVEFFELIDKCKFEIFALSYKNREPSPLLLRITEPFARFIDVSEMTDSQISELSRDLQIDIAIDLGGYTTDNRPGVFAHRPAPIQLSYIGYLGTMGTNNYDYLIADKTLIPVECQKFYAEKIIYLPCYQVNDSKRKISHKKFSRGELGLPDDTFVFCCFNQAAKILPKTFAGWMRILLHTKNTVLFLYAANSQIEINLRAHAESLGVSSDRLFFGGSLPTEEYLARYQVCDLFLDTFPYNAGTTASDALWAGLPVITLMGQSFASRYAASLLNAIDLTELITKSQEEYELLAIELANNPAKIENIKSRLKKNISTSKLFDTPSFTKNFEMVMIKIVERDADGLFPDHIFVE